MNKIKYYKDTNLTIGKYALKRMLNVFGIATPIERVSQYFGYPEELIREWESEHQVPDDEAVMIIKKLTGESPDDYVTEKSQAIDFILNPH